MKKNEKYPEKLTGIMQENPFRVPDGYFDNFYARLETRLNATEVSPAAKKEVHIYHYLKPALAIAASLVAVILMLFSPLGSMRLKNLAHSNQISITSMDDFYNTMVSNLDENSFYALLSEPEKKDKLSDDDIASLVNTTFSDYEIFVVTK